MKRKYDDSKSPAKWREMIISMFSRLETHYFTLSLRSLPIAISSQVQIVPLHQIQILFNLSFFKPIMPAIPATKFNPDGLTETMAVISEKNLRSDGESTPQKRRLRSTVSPQSSTWKSPRRCINSSPHTLDTVSLSVEIV